MCEAGQAVALADGVRKRPRGGRTLNRALACLYHPFDHPGGYSTNEIPDNWTERIMGYDNTDNRLLKKERDTVREEAKKRPNPRQ